MQLNRPPENQDAIRVSTMPSKIQNSTYPSPMAHLFLAIFLIVFGLNIVVGLSIPMWVIGILALVAGLLLVMEHFRVRVDKKRPPGSL